MAEEKKPRKARVSPASALESTTPRKTKRPETSNAAPTTPAYMSKYMVGDQISHPMFGNGTVTAIHTNKLTIEFPHSVIKQIVDDFVTSGAIGREERGLHFSAASIL